MARQVHLYSGGMAARGAWGEGGVRTALLLCNLQRTLQQAPVAFAWDTYKSQSSVLSFSSRVCSEAEVNRTTRDERPAGRGLKKVRTVFT